MRNTTGLLRFTLLALTFLLAACSGPRKMMPTPNLYVGGDASHYADLNSELKSTEVRLLYATDREPIRDEQGQLDYGSGRSASLAFGTVDVDLGADVTWEELVEASRTNTRLKDVHLEMGQPTELVRGPPVPLPYARIDGEIVERPDLVALRSKAREDFHAALVKRLSLTSRKEVFVYVHGYHNTFADAAYAMAELWHFVGRVGVPIVYSWPAGYPGIFGYTYDRESSEFTVYHLRRFLSLIAGFPEVEKIHVIAHSRGTDVAVNALREMTLTVRGSGVDPRDEFKIHNFILAAADMDVQVAEQRLIGDNIAQSVGRLTLYTSPNDKALGIATTLFESPRGRIGRYDFDSVSDLTRTAMEYGTADLSVINFSGTGDASSDAYGHSYFRNAPTVSSDLVLMLRDDADAGTPQRPLTPDGLKFWTIPPNYPPQN